MIDEKRLLEWIRREKFWQKRELASCSNLSMLQAYFAGAEWALNRVSKWVKEEKMEPEEIAEKTADSLPSCNNCCLCGDHLRHIAAKIQAYGLQQRREAVLEKFEGENCVVADLERKAYAEGFKAAKEKAKGIADDMEEQLGLSDTQIAQRIDGMTP